MSRDTSWLIKSTTTYHKHNNKFYEIFTYYLISRINIWTFEAYGIVSSKHNYKSCYSDCELKLTMRFCKFMCSGIIRNLCDKISLSNVIWSGDRTNSASHSVLDTEPLKLIKRNVGLQSPLDLHFQVAPDWENPKLSSSFSEVNCWREFFFIAQL